MTGVVKVLRDGNFLAVVAYREFQAIKAMRAMSLAARWEGGEALPKQAQLHETLLGLPAEEQVIFDKHESTGQPAHALEATYTRPYLSHGSVGPSCAVAHLTDGVMTIWTHTQGVYPDRQAIAEMLRMPQDKVRCIHVEGSGCYGHNGADDAAADAALIANSLPDRPIRLQWMREQEHGWEPFGPAMLTKVRASLDSAGHIVDWDYGVWSNTHTMRPGPAGPCSRPNTWRFVSDPGAEAHPATGRRRRPQLDSPLHAAQREDHSSLPARHATAMLRPEIAWRADERIRDRELHG